MISSADPNSLKTLFDPSSGGTTKQRKSPSRTSPASKYTNIKLIPTSSATISKPEDYSDSSLLSHPNNQN